MVKEEWKQIITFPNYKISNYGNVISLNYRNTKKEKLMSINVIYDLEDGNPELIVTTLMYCKLEKTWRDERGANYIVNTVKLWKPLPQASTNK